MSNISDKILALTRQLYPRGRVFNMAKDSNVEKLHKALGESETRAYEDALSILDSILPDNPNFTPDDATDWNVRLGMIVNLAASQSDRNSAIIRKMNHPGDIPARQSHDYLQDSLQLAGFDVYVHENIPEQGIISVLGLTSGAPQLGDGQLGDFQHANVFSIFSLLLLKMQHGDYQLGDGQHDQYFYTQKVANHIDYLLDINFNVGVNLRSTFYIGGQTFGDFANVDLNRRDEFRQLILKIKPAQAVSFNLINYI